MAFWEALLGIKTYREEYSNALRDTARYQQRLQEYQIRQVQLNQIAVNRAMAQGMASALSIIRKAREDDVPFEVMEDGLNKIIFELREKACSYENLDEEGRAALMELAKDRQKMLQERQAAAFGREEPKDG